MINGSLFRGERIRLSLVEPEVNAKNWSHWNRNSSFQRYLDSSPSMLFSAKKIKEWIEKEAESEAGKEYNFHILAQPDDRFIGFTGLFIPNWNQGDAWVGIGIGEPEDWSKGYGTEAMQLVLQYAFMELNLHRVSLGVFGYNPRAFRSYEKAGFKVEGRERGSLYRDGEHADLIYMGILCSEWLALHAPQALNEGAADR